MQTWSGSAKQSLLRFHYSIHKTIRCFSLYKHYLMLLLFDSWVHILSQVWPFSWFMFVFMNESCVEWRDIRHVVQQYWKYLKLPEMYYFSGKWTVNVMSNQGTLFWIILIICESIHAVSKHTCSSCFKTRSCEAWKNTIKIEEKKRHSDGHLVLAGSDL